MRRTSSSFLVAALLALAGAACDLDTDTTEPSDRAAETAQDGSLQGPPARMPGPPSLTDMVAMAAQSVDAIDVDQLAQIELVREDLHAELAVARPDVVGFHEALAEALVECRFDAPEIDAARTELVAAAGVAGDADGLALQELHGLLDRSQRAAIVAELEANAPDGPPAGHLRELARQMALTDDQIATIHDRLEVPDPMRVTTPESILTSWTTEDFSADALDLAGLTRTRTEDHTAHFVDLVEVMCEVADDEQRLRLGDLLTSPPPQGPPQGPPPPRP